MAGTESARHDLYNGLRKVLGEERAETLVTYLPAYDPAEVATQGDMREFKSEMAEFRSEMREDFTAFRSEMREDFTAFRSEMREDFTAFRSEMREEFAAFRSEIQTQFVSLDKRMHGVMLTLAAGLFVVVASVIGLVGVVLRAM